MFILYSTDYFIPVQWWNCSYQQHWSGHFQQPSWVGFSLRHRHCSPERCGSAAAEDTPHGQWRLLHAVGSCKNIIRTRLILKKNQIVILFFMWTFNSLDIAPVFTVFGIDNGRAKSVYQHLSSTFIVMDPTKRGECNYFISSSPHMHWSKLNAAQDLTQHSGGGWKNCLRPCEKPPVPAKPPHTYRDLQRENMNHMRLHLTIRALLKHSSLSTCVKI